MPRQECLPARRVLFSNVLPSSYTVSSRLFFHLHKRYEYLHSSGWPPRRPPFSILVLCRTIIRHKRERCQCYCMLDTSKRVASPVSYNISGYTKSASTIHSGPLECTQLCRKRASQRQNNPQQRRMHIRIDACFRTSWNVAVPVAALRR